MARHRERATSRTLTTPFPTPMASVPSRAKPRAQIQPPWSCSVSRSLRVARSQSFTELSRLPDARIRPSGLIASESTSSAMPFQHAQLPTRQPVPEGHSAPVGEREGPPVGRHRQSLDPTRESGPERRSLAPGRHVPDFHRAVQ